MERQVLADFVRILKISQESKIDGPLLQYLSIMIQNMDSEHAICKMVDSYLLMSLVKLIDFWVLLVYAYLVDIYM